MLRAYAHVWHAENEGNLTPPFLVTQNTIDSEILKVLPEFPAFPEIRPGRKWLMINDRNGHKELIKNTD